jgi:hypothetical protein
LSESVQELIHNQFPSLREVSDRDLLQCYAHDLAHATWDSSSAQIVYAHLLTRRSTWKHVADVHVTMWEVKTLLIQLCELAKCSQRITSGIISLLRKEGFNEQDLLLELILHTLEVIARMTSGKSTKKGKAYLRAARAFLILRKLLPQLPPERKQEAMKNYHTEHIMFHFHFDYTSQQDSSLAAANFRKSVLDVFPCRMSTYLKFASTLNNFPVGGFLHKYLCMFVVPMAFLIGIKDEGVQSVLQECLLLALKINPNVS